MKLLFLIYIALFLSLIVAQTTQCNALMRKLNSESQLSLTCRKTTQFGFCAYTLGSDPRSKGANVNGLVHIALDKLEASAKDTLSYVHKFQGSVAGNERQVIGNCIQLYSAMANMKVSIPIASLNTNAYSVDKQVVGAAMTSGHGCQERIDKHPSPKWQMLSARNKYTNDLSQLASDLIKLLG